MMANNSPNLSDCRGRHRELYKMTTPPWKETYRNRCLDRFRKSRERLVNSFRNLQCVDGLLGETPVVIGDLVDEEWLSLRMQIGNEPDVCDHFEDVRNEVLQELLAEEQQLNQEYEASLRLEQQINTSMAVGSNDVLCPLCQKQKLKQTGRIIHCLCGLCIDTEQDAVTLSFVKEQLFNGLHFHNVTCAEDPRFTQVQAPGITNLLLTCATCDYMYIVI